MVPHCACCCCEAVGPNSTVGSGACGRMQLIGWLVVFSFSYFKPPPEFLNGNVHVQATVWAASAAAVAASVALIFGQLMLYLMRSIFGRTQSKQKERVLRLLLPLPPRPPAPLSTIKATIGGGGFLLRGFFCTMVRAHSREGLKLSPCCKVAI